jgi:DNA repair/transcription protein MET18/MMS19
MLRTLYPDDSEGGLVVDGIIVTIVNACLVDIKTPESNDGKAATKSLSAAASASGPLAQYVSGRVVPPLMILATDSQEVSRRPAVLAALGSLLRAHRSAAPRSSPNALAPFKDELLSILASGTRSSATLPAAATALVELAQTPDLLDPAELDFALEAASVLVLNDDEGQVDDAEADAVLAGLAAVGKSSLDPFKRTTLARLVARLPERGPGPGDEARYRRALGALNRLGSSEPALAVPIADQLLGRVERLADEPRETAALYGHHLLATLKAVTKGRTQWGGEEGAMLVARLLAILVAHAATEMDPGTVVTDTRVVLDAAGIVGTVMQHLDAE